MEEKTPLIAEVRSLAEAVCAGSIQPKQCARLNALLLDEEAALTYAVYLRMHGLLCWHWQDQATVVKTSETPPRMQLSAGAPPLGLLGGAWQGTVVFFSHTVPFSYLTATLILGVMLLSAWALKITRYPLIVEAPRATTGAETDWTFVGQITGLKDCRWSDPNTETINGASVPLGRKYALASGLMEITYDSGAKVILQGPCNYEVESPAGGYLSLGKLTARVVSGQWPVASAKPQAANPKSPNLQISKSPNPSPLSPLHSPLFTVRTPTAVVTDLGTEFGVEVSKDASDVQVFEGTVIVTAKEGDSTGGPQTLGVGETVRVERDAEGITRILSAVAPASVEPARFVRRMPQFDPDAYAKAVLGDNPVAYWRMNEIGGDGTAVFDSANASGSPQQGAQNGIFITDNPNAGLEYAGPRPTNGYVGFRADNKAPRFWNTCDGTTRVDARNPTALQITGPLTLEAWIYIEKPCTTDRGIVSKEHYPSQNRSYSLGLAKGNKPSFIISDDGLMSRKVLTSTTALPMDTWVHLAAVYVPGKSMAIYLNGVVDTKDIWDVPESIYNSSANLWIGLRYATKNDLGFQGRIDEVAVYDTALSGVRIAVHYVAAARGRIVRTAPTTARPTAPSPTLSWCPTSPERFPTQSWLSCFPCSTRESACSEAPRRGTAGHVFSLSSLFTHSSHAPHGNPRFPTLCVGEVECVFPLISLFSPFLL